ncbi:hypothetical protein T484DRAFT_1855553 [Baffinella frigidus]|nr:hypothetical protein T484DRAFT_1855553 [Cryptophyta sp. CCMP2293]
MLGPGSYLANTEASRAFLSRVITDYNVSSVFDAGCGDVNWQRLADAIERGPGSYLANTEASRAFLSRVITDYNVSSVFDAGCGDVNWQKKVDAIGRVRYVGADVVPDMITANRREFASFKNMEFLQHDLVKDAIPENFDLILCRDTLFHLPLWDAVEVLRKFDASGAKYLMAHFDEDLAHNWPDISAGKYLMAHFDENLARNWPDIPAGAWHNVNLLAAPFRLPPPLLSLPESGRRGGRWDY